MKKLKIACLFGGSSSEYQISLLSASSVLKNINQEKYDVIMIGITKDGNFYLYNGNIEKIESDTWFNQNDCQKITFSSNKIDHGIIIINTQEIIKIDIAMPILHGQNGEDGRLQGLLELANIPYVGCGVSASSIGMDKYLAHELVKNHNILTPNNYRFSKNDNYLTIKKKIENLKYPIYVKPLRGGSSIGITKVNELNNLNKALKLAFSFDDFIIIEESINGFEVGCAILGNDNLVVGEVDEVDIQKSFFDYEEKYHTKTSQIILPARLPKNVREEIKKTALKIYQILDCQGLARVDLFYTKDKKIVFNEVNTLPGFTVHSRFPSMLKEAGYSFTEIIDELIKLGLENKR